MQKLNYSSNEMVINMIAHAVAEAELPTERDPDRELAELSAKWVQSGEGIARLLEEAADDVLEAAFLDNSAINCPGWQEYACSVARMLEANGRAETEKECPTEPKTLRQLYAAWAKCCEDVAWNLRQLAKPETGSRTAPLVRICMVEEELIAMQTHSAARRIYLSGLGIEVPACRWLFPGSCWANKGQPLVW